MSQEPFSEAKGCVTEFENTDCDVNRVKKGVSKTRKVAYERRIYSCRRPERRAF